MLRLSKFLSVLFHPLAIPFISASLLIWVNPFVFGGAKSGVALSFLYVIVLCTLVMPLVGFLVLSRLNFNANSDLSPKQERIIPYFMVIFCYSIAIYYINQLPLPSQFKAMMFGASASIILSFFWGNFLNISAHGVGMGTLLGVIISLFFIGYRDVDTVLILGFLFSGLVLSAQVYMSKNSVRAVFTGFIIGLASQLITFIILSAIQV